MPNAMKFTIPAPPDSVYVTHNPTGPPVSVWVRFLIYLEASALAPTNGDFGGDFLDFSGVTGCVYTENVLGSVMWGDCGDGTTAVSLTSGQWYTVDSYTDSTAACSTELWVDNVQIAVSAPFDNTGAVTTVQWGYRFPGGWENGAVFYMKDLAIGTTRGASDIFAPDLDSGDPLNVIFDSVIENAPSTVDLVEEPTPPATAARRLNRWRYLLADLDGTPISFWDVQARNRQIEYTLNGITAISGSIDSGNPQANLTFTDGFPYLSEGDRLLYAFRRDYDGGGSTYPWTCRAAGIIMEVDDTGDVDKAETTFTAYDPWQYLMSLPLVNPDHPFDGTYDVTYVDSPLDDIVVSLLTNVGFYTTNLGGAAGIDLTGGTIEALPNETMTFQRETSIGQCLQMCAAQGCDIVLTPVYDPARPGILCDLNVYAYAGDLRPDATFAWDKGRRSVVNDNRQIDGTQRQNNVRYHLRAESDSSEVSVTVSEPASITRFGDYYGTRYLPAFDGAMLAEEAAQVLSEFSENKRTVSLGPVPERSPDLFTEYYLGDFVRVYASKKLRASQSGYQRVTGFTVEISDDALETVRDLRVYIPLEPAS